jgi:hypothetical protein
MVTKMEVVGSDVQRTCSKSTASVVEAKLFCVGGFGDPSRRGLPATKPMLDRHRGYTRCSLLARVLRALGHEVRLLAPQFVKPYLKSQKNDANDAEAICEARAVRSNIGPAAKSTYMVTKSDVRACARCS